LIPKLLLFLAGFAGILVVAVACMILFFAASRGTDEWRQAARVKAAMLAAARGKVVPGAETVVLDDGARLDEVQLIATHNSSHRLPDPLRLFLIGLAVPGEPAKLRYAHQYLTDQLDAGIRSIELDVRRKGDRFIVSHVPFVDDRSNCPDFDLALEELRLWSERTPGHVPVLVLLELKDDALSRIPGMKRFDRRGLDLLDGTIRSAFADSQLLRPDDVRGGAPTLEAAVLERGWPTIRECRGRFLFILHENARLRGLFLEGNPVLSGRVMFTCASPGSPDAAVLLRNDPVTHGPSIRDLVARHYMVRTRADAELKADPRRFDEALASGAQIVTTDFPPSEPPHPSGYVCSFPGGLLGRMRPR